MNNVLKTVEKMPHVLTCLLTLLFFLSRPADEEECRNFALHFCRGGTMAVSPYRFTTAGETSYHYGYAENAASFQGGLRPGGFATSSGNLTAAEAQSGLLDFSPSEACFGIDSTVLFTSRFLAQPAHRPHGALLLRRTLLRAEQRALPLPRPAGTRREFQPLRLRRGQPLQWARPGWENWRANIPMSPTRRIPPGRMPTRFSTIIKPVIQNTRPTG